MTERGGLAVPEGSASASHDDKKLRRTGSDAVPTASSPCLSLTDPFLAGDPGSTGTIAACDFAAENADRLRFIRTVLVVWPALVGIVALVGWAAVWAGDSSRWSLAVGFSAATALVCFGYGLLFARPPDWPISIDVGTRELRIRYRWKADLVIPWPDPSGRLIVVDTPVAPGRRATNPRPIVIALGNRFVAAVSLATWDAWKVELAAQGYRLEPVTLRSVFRLMWGLPLGSTPLRIVRFRRPDSSA